MTEQYHDSSLSKQQPQRTYFNGWTVEEGLRQVERRIAANKERRAQFLLDREAQRIELGDQHDAVIAEAFEPFVMDIMKALGEFVQNLWPQRPGGGLVPAHNRRLWTQARWAYSRPHPYPYRVEFLKAIGEEPSLENIFLLQQLLGPHFAPQKPWKRAEWEMASQEKAIQFLKGRLRSIEREIEEENARKAKALQTQHASEEEIEEAVTKKFLRAQDETAKL